MKNTKYSYKNNKLKISAPNWSEEFELPDRSYSYYIFKITFCIYIYIYIYKHGEKTDNPSLRIYVNKTENRILFKIKTGYYLDLLTPEMMKLFGSTKSEITKDENGENEPPLEIA